MTTIFWLAVFIAVCGYISFCSGVLLVLSQDEQTNRILAIHGQWPIKPMRLVIAIAATIVAVTI